MNMKTKLIALLGTGSMVGLSLGTFFGLEAGTRELPAHPEASVAAHESTVVGESVVCSSLLEQDENQVLAAEYGTAVVADCMFVGCGGLY